MTRAKDISKIITDADFSGTLDVTGAFTSQGIDDNADATAITITSAENVGIGTSSPDELLHLKTNSNAYKMLKLEADTAGGDAGILLQGQNGNQFEIHQPYDSAGLFFYDRTNGTERMRINSSGNVGIGTTYAVGRLNVLAASNSEGVNVLGRSSDNRSRIQLKSNDGSTLYSQWDYSGTTVDFKVVSNIPLTFYTNSTERMRITSSGNVGIGTTSPSETLDVVGDAKATRLIGRAFMESSSGVLSDTFSVIGGTTSNSSTSHGGVFFSKHVDSYSLLVGTHDQSFNSFVVKGNGNVGIGTTSPTVSGKGIEIHNEGNDTLACIRLAANNNTGTPGQKFNTELRYNGGGGSFQIMHYGSGNSLGTERFRISAAGDTFTNDGSVSSLSDSRVKKDIADLQDGLAIVNQLRPVTFKYNGAASMTPDDDKINYGFIADEVQAVASHYVQENTEEINGVTVTDLKSLSTGRMIPMLFKAVQELSAKVNTLETANTALEARITALETA